MSTLLRKVLDRIVEAERQVQTFGKGTTISLQENLDEVSMDNLRAAHGQAKVSGKASGDVTTEAKKVVGLKQHEAKDAAMVAGLQAGGKPSTWLPPGGLAEWLQAKK